MSLVWLAAGAILAGLGLALMRASMRRLARSGALGSVFWHSFREYGAYRRRALRPVLLTLVGFIAGLVGLVLLGAGAVSYYSDRLGHPG